MRAWAQKLADSVWRFINEAIQELAKDGSGTVEGSLNVQGKRLGDDDRKMVKLCASPLCGSNKGSRQADHHRFAKGEGAPAGVPWPRHSTPSVSRAS